LAESKRDVVLLSQKIFAPNFQTTNTSNISKMFFGNAEDNNMLKLKKAEAKLIEYTKKFGDRDPTSFRITTQDTIIPSEVLPLKTKSLKQDLLMHSVSVSGTELDPSKHDTPLVILHGYMNGALYFYRNLVGLSNHFDTVYSLDTLGCGLSSRGPAGLLSSLSSKVDNRSLEDTTEEFFVEALEAWREANGISKMVLAGHSMGGYISVAYSEKYPERVEQLILLSPAGVTRENQDEIDDMLNQLSWTQRAALNSVRYLYSAGVTPASFSRKLPTSKSRSMVVSYVDRRLPVVKDPDEQQALAEYLHIMAMIPGFGEDMLNRFLTSSAHGVKPTVDRIPLLQVAKVSFLYGDRDWMDIQGGIDAYEQASTFGKNGPSIQVYQLQEAGHLLMLDNWRGFHAGVVAMVSGRSAVSPKYPMPALVRGGRAKNHNNFAPRVGRKFQQQSR
jgi:cardiolipin-specific phospholipase